MYRTLALALLLTACTGSTKDTGGDEIVGDATAGADLYAANCAACHGANGEGGTGPAMSEVATKSDAEIEGYIVNGSDDGAMPPFPNLTEQEIADIIAYIRANY
ncbi:MAG: c-type cytochrome [Myxococcota bacterium]